MVKSKMIFVKIQMIGKIFIEKNVTNSPALHSGLFVLNSCVIPVVGYSSEKV